MAFFLAELGFGSVVGIAFACLILFLMVMAAINMVLFIRRPNEVLIISGRRNTLANGQSVGFTPIFGSWTLRIPIKEQVSRMDLTNMEVEIGIQNAYSQGGIPLNVQATANVKLSDDPKVVGNAIERFLGRSREEIRNTAKQMLEGHLRGIISGLTPEHINSDRIKFAHSLTEEAEPDLRKLGLHLDTFNIHHVADDINYLNSVGRKKIAEIHREAEIAESNAAREAAQQESIANGEAQVAKERAEQAITTKTNEVRRAKADLEAAAKSQEERAKAGAETARAVAEQELQRIRAELEGKRLMADVVVRAEAENKAKAILARGQAAPIAERGKATAASIDLLNAAWTEAGEGAKAIIVIQQLEPILKQIVERLGHVKVGTVTLVDRGDGSSLPNYIASYPAAVGRVLGELRAAVGIDVTGTLAGNGAGSNGQAPVADERSAS
ncbi:flotillin family protein [bacterium]|nr:flotillin family protein [bacterium]